MRTTTAAQHYPCGALDWRCCFGREEIPGPRAHGQLAPAGRVYLNSNRAVSTSFRICRSVAERVLMADIRCDLPANTHDFRRSHGEMYLSPGVRSELFENFRILVSGVFVK